MHRLLLFFSFFAFCSTAYGAVPQQLHYTGHLTNNAGEAVDCPDSVQCVENYTIKFRLYDSSDGGTPLWEEEYNNVPIYAGSFHATLGTVNPINPSLINGPTWLEIQINEHEEMSPRQKIVSAAYAIRAGHAEAAIEAENANQLGGVSATDYATNDTVIGLEATLAPVATEGLPGDLADGDDDTLGDLVCGEGMVPKTTAMGIWACGPDSDTTVADTTLSEETVDLMVSNNGFASSSAVGSLQDDLTSLQSSLATAQSNLSALQESLNTISDASSLNATGVQSNGTGLETLQAQVTGFEDLVAALQGEITLVETTIGLVQTQVNSFEDLVAALNSNLADEVTARTSADGVLDSKIANESSARIAADDDLSNAINTEVTARTNADINLQQNLDIESTVREAKDQQLSLSIETLQEDLANTPAGQWLKEPDQIRPNNTGELVIRNTGQLGVGTATPNNFKLEVKGEGAAPGHVALFSSKQSYAYVGIASTDESIYLSMGNDRIFRLHEPGVGDRLVSTPDGKVGIGTSSPTQKLSVEGTIETMGPQGGIKFPDGSIQTTAATPTALGGSTFYISGNCPPFWNQTHVGPITGNGDMNVCYRTDKQCAVFYTQAWRACPPGWPETGTSSPIWGGGDTKVCYRCP